MKWLKSMQSNLKKWWRGNDFYVGDKVYWDNKVHPEFTGEYIVTSKRNENRLVGIYNDKMKNRMIYDFELKHVRDK